MLRWRENNLFYCNTKPKTQPSQRRTPISIPTNLQHAHAISNQLVDCMCSQSSSCLFIFGMKNDDASSSIGYQIVHSNEAHLPLLLNYFSSIKWRRTVSPSLPLWLRISVRAFSSHKCFKIIANALLVVVTAIQPRNPPPSLLHSPINTYAPFVLSQMRPVIDDGRVDGFDAAKLTAHAQDEHHKEEQYGPELWQWHQENSLLSGLMNDQRRRWWVDLQWKHKMVRI